MTPNNLWFITWAYDPSDKPVGHPSVEAHFIVQAPYLDYAKALLMNSVQDMEVIPRGFSNTGPAAQQIARLGIRRSQCSIIGVDQRELGHLPWAKIPEPMCGLPFGGYDGDGICHRELCAYYAGKCTLGR